jgi:hypothetical protein
MARKNAPLPVFEWNPNTSNPKLKDSIYNAPPMRDVAPPSTSPVPMRCPPKPYPGKVK